MQPADLDEFEGKFTGYIGSIFTDFPDMKYPPRMRDARAGKAFRFPSREGP